MFAKSRTLYCPVSLDGQIVETFEYLRSVLDSQMNFSENTDCLQIVFMKIQSS